MREGTRTALLVEGQVDEEIVKQATAAALAAAPENRVRAGLEAVVAAAEGDPAAARSALHKLRGDPEALRQIEVHLDGSRERATFALGAAIQIADAELAGEAPDLQGRLPELLRWLEGDW